MVDKSMDQPASEPDVPTWVGVTLVTSAFVAVSGNIYATLVGSRTLNPATGQTYRFDLHAKGSHATVYLDRGETIASGIGTMGRASCWRSFFRFISTT